MGVQALSDSPLGTAIAPGLRLSRAEKGSNPRQRPGGLFPDSGPWGPRGGPGSKPRARGNRLRKLGAPGRGGWGFTAVTFPCGTQAGSLGASPASLAPNYIRVPGSFSPRRPRPRGPRSAAVIKELAKRHPPRASRTGKSPSFAGGPWELVGTGFSWVGCAVTVKPGRCFKFLCCTAAQERSP